jgi:peptidyl-prolyl cis-trans isomerase C
MVVTVNGKEITEGEVSEQVEKRIAAQKQRMPQGMELPGAAKANAPRKSVVDMLVEKELISQKLAEENITVTDEQVTQEIKTLTDQRNQTLEALELELAQHGMTLADLKEQVGFKLRVDTLMETAMGSASVTEADAQAFYADNPQHFDRPEQVKASHILRGKRGITEAEYPAELEKIKAAQARLNAGEAFSDVAKMSRPARPAPRAATWAFSARVRWTRRSRRPRLRWRWANQRHCEVQLWVSPHHRSPIRSPPARLPSRRSRTRLPST